MSNQYIPPRLSVTVDCVIFGLDEAALKVLLIQRGTPPFQGQWALPGGFVHPEEAVDTAAMRELYEETGVTRVFLEQLYTFGDVNRDPRCRIITVAYYALVNLHDQCLQAATDASRAQWFPVTAVPTLAFDHSTILATALKRLKGKVRYEPIGFELLPKRFTLSHLQKLYETILEHPLDKRNFRKKILSMGLLIKLDEMEQGVAHRAARLYQFDEQRYQQLKAEGWNFEI